MQLSIVTNKKDEVLDITDLVEQQIIKSGVGSGNYLIFVKHTTCCITTADLDPGTDLDLLDALRKTLPDMKYRHPHDPSHTPDHILSSIIGPSLLVPFAKNELLLGVWQRIVLIELDGPRERLIEVNIIK